MNVIHCNLCRICGEMIATYDRHKHICASCFTAWGLYKPHACFPTNPLLAIVEKLKRSDEMSCHTYEYRIVETLEGAMDRNRLGGLEGRVDTCDVEPKILAKGDIPYAQNLDVAKQEVARKIPEEYKASQVEIYVRPFVQ